MSTSLHEVHFIINYIIMLNFYGQQSPQCMLRIHFINLIELTNNLHTIGVEQLIGDIISGIAGP